MRYRILIRGVSPIIHHNGAAGLDTRSPAKLEISEITRKTGSNRTVADDQRLVELECQNSLWLDESGAPAIPEGAVRSCIEQSARKLRQGSQVREGLIVTETHFAYDMQRYGCTVGELGKSAAFTVPVVVQRARILRTRAKFDEWSCAFVVDCDDELVDGRQLRTWVEIAGQRIGLGDWRPQRSGHYGRFEVAEFEEMEEVL